MEGIIKKAENGYIVICKDISVDTKKVYIFKDGDLGKAFDEIETFFLWSKDEVEKEK